VTGRYRNHVQKRDFEGADLLDLQALYLPALPLHVTLGCRSELAPVPSAVTTSRAVWMAYRRLRRVVFGVIEWSALVASVGNDRARPADFVDWCRAKAERPTWKVTLRDTIGALPKHSVVPAQGVTVGRVLAVFGLVLEAVWYGDAVPVPVKGAV